VTPPVWSDGSAVVAWARAHRATGGTQHALLLTVLAHLVEARAGDPALVAAELPALCRSPGVAGALRAAVAALLAPPDELPTSLCTAVAAVAGATSAALDRERAAREASEVATAAERAALDQERVAHKETARALEALREELAWKGKQLDRALAPQKAEQELKKRVADAAKRGPDRYEVGGRVYWDKDEAREAYQSQRLSAQLEREGMCRT
jgi:hypothetical protein